jgi:hypothetical protein
MPDWVVDGARLKFLRRERGVVIQDGNRSAEYEYDNGDDVDE